ncbi:MAG: ATP-dependent DNA helicase [Candidatus Micrarchaeota archaeon]
MYFRHPSIRKGQLQMMEDILGALENKKHILCHAPTGMGKTDSSLSPALTYALENGQSIFFLTPKISQHKIAVQALGGIAEKHSLSFRAADLVGRRHMCPDASLLSLDYDGFYQTCKKRRVEERCGFYANARGFTRAQERAAARNLEKIMKGYGPVQGHEEVARRCIEEECCSYEVAARIASESQVVVADYFQLMNPEIRAIFLSRSKKRISDSIVIIDEAHNLAPRVREHLSSTINAHTLKRALTEAKLLASELPIRKLLAKFEKRTEKELEGKTEMLTQTDYWFGLLSDSGFDIKTAADSFEQLGREYLEKTSRRSSALKLASFTRKWGESGEGDIRILRKKGGCSLSKRCLDPSRATSFLNTAHSAILMSGTLLPLEMHRDLVGLAPERTILKEYESSFPKDNTLNIIATNSTTRFSKRSFEEYSKIARTIDLIVPTVPGGVGVFFPSYKVLSGVLPLLNSKSLLVQKEKMTPKEVSGLLSRFVSSERGVLCGVQGGSLAEGIDMPNGEMKCAIMVGIALEEMNIEVEALIDYYEGKFGKGWEYGYLYPGVIRALQASGRCVRSERDKAVLVFLDERFKWKNYSRCFPRNFECSVTPEPEKYSEAFWASDI